MLAKCRIIVSGVLYFGFVTLILNDLFSILSKITLQYSNWLLKKYIYKDSKACTSINVVQTLLIKSHSFRNITTNNYDL